MTARRCTGTTKAGNPCKASPLHHRETCLAHSDADTRASVGFTPEAGALGGRPRAPRPSEVAQRLVEQHIWAVLRPYFKTLGLELHDDGSVTECEGPIKYVWAGVEDPAVPMLDLGAQMHAAELLQDRIYGKARQAVEVTGADGGPVETTARVDLSSLSLEERDQLEQLLERAAPADGPAVAE